MSDFQAGQRVEIIGDPIGIHLWSRTGTIVRQWTEWPCSLLLDDTVAQEDELKYYLIHLDSPAEYTAAPYLLSEMIQAADNLRLLPDITS